MKRQKTVLLLLLLCLALSGCRVRTTGNSGLQGENEGEAGSPPRSPVTGSLPDGRAEDDRTEEAEGNEAAGGQTRENPEAARKEYDENAPAEILPGTERLIHAGGEGEGASAAAEKTETTEKTVTKLNDSAEETATLTIAAEEAEQTGVSGDAPEADSAMTYFTALLRDRTGSLFECQRLNAYWEGPEDHVTIHRTSTEHGLLLNAGTYDVSARLLEENLRVDDGWIGRKNPGVIVRIVDRSVLGSGVSSTDAARRAVAGLLAREGWSALDAARNGRVILLSEELLEAPWLRTAAMLAIARTAYPALMADTDIDQALNMLAEEATGSVPDGIYYYKEGGF